MFKLKYQFTDFLFRFLFSLILIGLNIYPHGCKRCVVKNCIIVQTLPTA